MQSALNVLHSCPIWLPTTQKWMYNMISHLPDRVENAIICDKTRNLDVFPHKNIHSKKETFIPFAIEEGLKRLGLINASFLLKKKLKETKADILHSHFGDRAWEDSNLKIRHHMKQIAHFYGYDVGMIIQEDARWKDRYLQLFERVDRVLCEGSFMAKSIEKLGCPAKKIRVYHLGVEVKRLPFKPRKWDRKSTLKVLIAGSFREKKGIPYALEVLAKLKNNVPLEINIIGDSDKRKKYLYEKENILSAARSYDLMDRITWHGIVSHETLIQEALNNHLFISPSVTARDGDTEGGCPVTIIELSATGMPVLSTTHCDIPEVVLDGETGYLSSERNIEELYNNTIKLLENADNWDKMAKKARAHISENYNIENQGTELAGIYDELL